MLAPVTARDGGWLAVDHIRVLGPFVGVTAPRLRAALAGLHATDPCHPVVCVLDHAGGRWLPMSADEFAGFGDGLVDEVDRPAGDERRRTRSSGAWSTSGSTAVRWCSPSVAGTSA